jgi:hypothetical protein
VSKSLDPQLPYIQVARGVAAKAAQLAARCNADYYRVRGVLDCFWEELADRRVLAKALDGPGCVVVTLEQAEAAICRPIGAGIADVVHAGFLEVRPDGYRVRGMSRYLDAERVRLSRHPRPTLVQPPSDGGFNPPPTPLQPPSNHPPRGVEGHRGERVEVRGERLETKGETGGVVAPPPPALSLAGVRLSELHANLTPPDAPPEAWGAGEFWTWAQCLRRDNGHTVEGWPGDVELARWWREARQLADVPTLKRAFMAFGADPHWEHKAKPPFPWRGWASQFSDFIPQRSAHAAR